MKIALISANLGQIDRPTFHVKQSLPYDSFVFTDENFPPREKAMTRRLQAKIPKFFGWQLKPGYDFYFWLDGSISLGHPDTLKFFSEQCQDQDIVVLRHGRRPDIRQEARYLRKGLKQKSTYILDRYLYEWTPEQIEEIYKDKEYKDDLMVQGGIFIYRDTMLVRQMFKEWWYLTTRYSIFDQIAFPYVLKKSEVKFKVLEIDFNQSEHFKLNGHKYHRDDHDKA